MLTLSRVVFEVKIYKGGAACVGMIIIQSSRKMSVDSEVLKWKHGRDVTVFSFLPTLRLAGKAGEWSFQLARLIHVFSNPIFKHMHLLNFKLQNCC
jgi:hypothetical protein